MVFTIQYIHAYSQAHKHTYKNKIIQVIQFDKKRNNLWSKALYQNHQAFYIAMFLAKDLKLYNHNQ